MAEHASKEDERALDVANEFVLSSGTVTVDLKKCRVLILFYPLKDEYLLPKGRKNVHETLEAAAIRETLEESGYHCTLVAHRLKTQAVGFSSGLHTEPIAIQQRIHQGIRKIIFWYLAEADSTMKPELGIQEAGENFKPHWVSYRDAELLPSFPEDQKVVETAVRALLWPDIGCH